MITVFLLIPHMRPFLYQLKTLSQPLLEERIDDFFERHAQKNQDISLPAQSFIRRCLVADPKVRMTSSEARRHAWFEGLEADDDYRRLRQEPKSLGRSRYRIAPPIEELPDVEKTLRQDDVIPETQLDPQPVAYSHRSGDRNLRLNHENFSPPYFGLL